MNRWYLLADVVLLMLVAAVILGGVGAGWAVLYVVFMYGNGVLTGRSRRARAGEGWWERQPRYVVLRVVAAGLVLFWLAVAGLLVVLL